VEGVSGERPPEDVRLIANEVEELTLQSELLGDYDYFDYDRDSEMDVGSSSAWREWLGELTRLTSLSIDCRSEWRKDFE